MSSPKWENITIFLRALFDGVIVTVARDLWVLFFLILFIFLAALGLHCCARAFSSCGEQGLLFVAVHGLLIAVASLVVEHGL